MLNITTNNGTKYGVIENCPNTTNSDIVIVEEECRQCAHLYTIHTKHTAPFTVTVKCNYFVTEDD